MNTNDWILLGLATETIVLLVLAVQNVLLRRKYRLERAKLIAMRAKSAYDGVIATLSWERELAGKKPNQVMLDDLKQDEL